MITLYTYGRFKGLPDASPFVVKAEMLLKLAGLSYETDTRGFGRAPKGKLPYIRDGADVVPDSTLIRLHVEKKYGFDYDQGLSDYQRGVAWSVEKMLEDHLYWIMVHWRWMDDAAFDRGARHFFRRVPALLRPLVIPMVRRKVRGALHAQGIGRYSDAEKNLLADRCVASLSRVLGDHRYLMGDRPCGADATLFAFLVTGLPEIFDTPVRTRLLTAPNLVAYNERMTAEFFPGGAGP